MPAQVFVSQAESPSPSLSSSNRPVTSPAPSYLSAFPHRPTQPTLTTALHRSHSHVDSLASNPASLAPSYRQSATTSPAGGATSTSSGSRNSDAATADVVAATAESESLAILYRRIIFADLPADQHVPALTADRRLDDQIYLLLAYLLRATVLPWYSKLTPNRQLLTEVVAIVSQIIQQVPTRIGVQPSSLAAPAAAPAWASAEDELGPVLGEADLDTAGKGATKLNHYRLHAFLGRELPLVLRQHYLDVRAARRKANTAWAPLVAALELAECGYDLADSVSAASVGAAPAPPPAAAARPSGLGATLDTFPAAAALYEEVESESAASPACIAQLHAALSPHPAVDRLYSVQGQLEPTYLRIAVSSLLGSLMPPEEWAVETEKFIVRDVTVMVLRNSLGKCSRPWFLVQSINKVLDVLGWPHDGSDGSSSFVDDDDRATAVALAARSAKEQNLRSQTTLFEQIFTAAFRFWTLLTLVCTMVLPHLVRAYFDIFNPHSAVPAAARHTHGHRQGWSELSSSSEASVRLPSATRHQRREGSVRLDRAMHGRYPSASIRSTFLSGDGAGERRHQQGRASVYEPSSGAVDETAEQLPPSASLSACYAAAAASVDYAVPWLQLLEEVTEARTRMLSSALFSLLYIGVGFAGFGRTIDRIITSKINTTLQDTEALSSVVASIRKGMMPDGHMPPAVPDPTTEVQAAEWRRLRHRLLQGMHPKLRIVLLGPDPAGQYLGVTRCLSPVCAPNAAGPNTHLAVMVLERVVCMLCPDLVEA